MPIVRLVSLVLVAAALTACGSATSTARWTPPDVAALIRSTWGSTIGFPSFAYSCRRLDDRGQVFTCLAEDPTHTVRLASFDVVCDGAKCTWTDYPSYIG
jgi:hypothetical protein